MSQRLSLMISCVMAATLSAGALSAAQVPSVLSDSGTAIEPQALNSALEAVHQQTGLQIVFVSSLTEGRTSPGAPAGLSAEQTLMRVLEGTGLAFQWLDAKTVQVREGSDAKADFSQRSTDSTGVANVHQLSTLVAQSSSSATDEGSVRDPAPSANQPQTTSSEPLQEIVVTAQKRIERLIDVPISVGTVSGERLETMQVNSLADMAGYVAGLSVAGGGSPGFRKLVLRGLSSGSDFTAPLIVTYIDEIPVGASSASPNGGSRAESFGLDLLPYDIDQIEVLRGPQGTLYGANAVGGVIKYALRKPNLTDFDARAGTSLESINRSAGAGWGGRASINLPLVSGTLGLRVSGFHQDNAGYIDNVGTGKNGTSDSTQSGGRAALLWQVSDQFSVQATALAQEIKADDMTLVSLDEVTRQPVYGPQSSDTRVPQPFEQQTRAYSLTLNWDIGLASLTSASGWSHLANKQTYDLSPNFGIFCSFACPDYPFSDAIAVYKPISEVEKFVQEIRLASAGNEQLEWMLGGFYTKEKPEEVSSLPTFTASGVPLPAQNNLYTSIVNNEFKEWSMFGNMTYKLTPRIDVSGGARYAKNTETNCVETGGAFGAGLVPCTSRPYDDVTTWMANSRFHLSRDSTIYLRVATGYRPGAGCESCGLPALGIPGIYQPDSLINYEVGFKSDLLDHRAQLDFSAFHIDWKDIQLQQSSPEGLLFIVNGSTAVSDGIELTTSYQLVPGMRLGATLGYTDAHLTQDAPPGADGKNGDQLPLSARWTGSITADYNRPLGAETTLLVGGGYRYRDSMNAMFESSATPEPMPPQSIVDLYGGLGVRNLSARLYVKNVFNNRSYGGFFTQRDPQRPLFSPVQPRTTGLSLDYQF